MADLAERDRYAKRTAGSLDNVRGSARAWRTGLTAFISLVTTGVIITGRTTTTNLTVGWRALVTALIGGGLLLAVLGLWQALAAEAGTEPKMQTLQDIRRAHGTLDAYDIYLAGKAANRIGWGQRTVAGAVVLLLAGIVVTWWAPAAPTPSVYLQVNHVGRITCGTLASSGSGQLYLISPGGHEVVVIPVSEVTNLALVTACP